MIARLPGSKRFRVELEGQGLELDREQLLDLLDEGARLTGYRLLRSELPTAAPRPPAPGKPRRRA